MNPTENNEELKDMVDDVVKDLDSQIRELKITKAIREPRKRTQK